jgi:hypothetical protein
VLNSHNFQSLITSSPSNSAAIITNWLSPTVAFSRIEDFPKRKGIYFLHLKDGGPLLYIGAAYAGNRDLKTRCSQYLQQGSGGESFTGKLATLKNISRSDAITFVRDNIEAKFLFANNLAEQVIKQRELLCIWAFHPPLNFIQPKSTLTSLKWE